MPAAVLRYVETGSYLAAQREQDDILVSLKDDFGKYKTRISPDVVRRALTAVARQTCEKFVYTDSALGLKYAQTKNAVELLERARIVLAADCTRAGGIPLGGDINEKSRKCMLLDTGLYLRESGLDMPEWATDPPERFVNRGKLAEMFAGLELKKSGSPLSDNRLFYWHREAKDANAEVDYVVQLGDEILPIEVKSGKRGTMKSLGILMREKGLRRAVRTSEENFGRIAGGAICVLPLYFVGELDRFLLDSAP